MYLIEVLVQAEEIPLLLVALLLELLIVHKGLCLLSRHGAWTGLKEAWKAGRVRERMQGHTSAFHVCG